ncbi:glycosyltransferase [Enterococcus gallinarum]|uniref:glycosyltransferase n=1 Tax=Enterococcus gallinarum TaxID=1353 RepID=UPI00214C3ED2|nr:glycosyltransferase [Enterococcus gallinarum]MCR1932557.1 glycosyltransferase [Enterococcus gallinarum]
MNNLNFLDKRYLQNTFPNVTNISEKKLKKILELLTYIEKENCIEDTTTYSPTNNVYDEIKEIDFTKKSTLSIVYIVKNEACQIQNSLKNSILCADEIIILDTGSTDHTIDLIKKINSEKIKIYSKCWENDFSKARNQANQYATSDWILTLDADETIDFNINIFRELLNYLNNFPILKDYVFQIKLVGPKKIFFAGRLIKNSNTFFYKGKVHETYSHKLKKDNFESIKLDFQILYKERQSLEKQNYYNELLIETQKIYPNDQRWTYFYVRDNFKKLTSKSIEQLTDNYLFTIPITFSSLKIDKYTHGLLVLRLTKYLEENQLNKFKEYFDISQTFFESIDLIYLKFLYKIYEISMQQNKLLEEFLMDYEQLPNKQEFYNIDYIDSIFADLLLKNDYISEAKIIYTDLYKKNDELPCFQQNIIKSILKK